MPVSLLLGSEAGRGFFRQAFMGAARLFFEKPVALLPGRSFSVGGQAYEVDFWCTPAALWAGAALLLFFTRPTFAGFARGLALVLPLSAAAMVANVTLSIALHQHGIDWTWAHYPGLFLIYAAVLLYCQRRPRTSAAAFAAQPGV